MSEMFAECINLCSLDILKINTEQVTDMKEMFINCKKIDKLDLRNFNLKNVTNMKINVSFL